MNITQDLQKWGNSIGIRLPKKVLSAANLQPNQSVIISIKSGSIILTPVKNNAEFNLESMLQGVTTDNVHLEVEWGNDIGRENING